MSRPPSLGALLLAALSSGCACESPTADEPDGAVLTLDARPIDPRLRCGGSLRARVLETPGGVRPERQSPRAASLGGSSDDRVLAWVEPRLPDGSFRWHLARIEPRTTALTEVASPWGADRPLLLLDDPAGPLALAGDNDVVLEHAWARWEGEGFGATAPLDLSVEADERGGNRIPCDGRTAIARVVLRDDGATGLQVLHWRDAGGPVRSEVLYPPDGAFGEARPLDLADRPWIAACGADARGVLHVVVGPGGRGRAPVVARFGETTFVERGASPAGDARGTVALSLGDDGTPRLFVVSRGELAAYALDAAPRALGSRAIDDDAFGAGVVGAAPVEGGHVLVYSDGLGTWATEWDDEASSFGAPILVTDLQCTSDDGFRRVGGALRLVASCTVGVGGAALVDFELCGGTP